VRLPTARKLVNFLGRLSLRWKLIAAVSLLVVLIDIGILMLVSGAQRRALETEIIASIDRNADSLSRMIVPAILHDDRLDIYVQLENSRRASHILAIAAVDTAGTPFSMTHSGYFEAFLQSDDFRSHMRRRAYGTFAHYAPSEEKEMRSYFSTIVANYDQVLGALLICYEQNWIYEQVRHLQRRVLLVGLVALAVGWLLTALLSRGIVAPIERLERAAVRIGAGEFGKTVEVETHDEIGALAETFNTMSIELKKREEEVRRAERLSAIGQTASVVAHEMKTPLTSVKTYVDMLSMKYEDASFRVKFSGTVEAQVNRLEKLVDDLLDYSRDTRLHMTQLDLSLHLHQAVAFFGDMIVAQRVTVYEDYRTEQAVAADPDKLEQIFFNLIRNAVEAQGESGALGLLTLDDGDDVVVLVADAGTGIPEETAATIFDPFVSTKAKGTGLGLAIARKITEAHRGTIEVRSPLKTLAEEYRTLVQKTLAEHWPGAGYGTCFVIRLPALRESDT